MRLAAQAVACLALARLRGVTQPGAPQPDPALAGALAALLAEPDGRAALLDAAAAPGEPIEPWAFVRDELLPHATPAQALGIAARWSAGPDRVDPRSLGFAKVRAAGPFVVDTRGRFTLMRAVAICAAHGDAALAHLDVVHARADRRAAELALVVAARPFVRFRLEGIWQPESGADRRAVDAAFGAHVVWFTAPRPRGKKKKAQSRLRGLLPVYAALATGHPLDDVRGWDEAEWLGGRDMLARAFAVLLQSPDVDQARLDVAWQNPHTRGFTAWLGVWRRVWDAPRLVALLEAHFTAACRGLGLLGEAAAVEALSPLVEAKAKGPRLLGARALATLPPRGPQQALAQRRLSKERDRAVRHWLARVADPSVEPAPVVALKAWRVDTPFEVQRDGIRDLFGWGLRPDAQDGTFAGIAMRCEADRMQDGWHARQADDGQNLRPELLVLLQSEWGDDPLAPWAAAESILADTQTDDGRRAYAVRRLIEGLWGALGARAVPVVRWAVDHGRSPARVALLRRFGRLFTRAKAWKGFEPAARQAAFELSLFAAALGDKATRQAEFEALTTHREAGRRAVPAAIGLLEHPEAAVRVTAAELIALHPTPEAVAPLTAALKAERAKGPKGALQDALDACAPIAAGPEPTDPAARDAALDARIARQRSGRVKRFIKPLPTLRWLSGAELSDKARRWLLTRLPDYDYRSPDATLVEVCDRIEPDDKALLWMQLREDCGERDTRWVLFSAIVLADDSGLEEIGLGIGSAFSVYAGHGLTILSHRPSPVSARWLNHYVREGQTLRLKRMARDGLAQVEPQLEVLPDYLSDRDGWSSTGAELLRLMIGEYAWTAAAWNARFDPSTGVSKCATGLVFERLGADGTSAGFVVLNGKRKPVDAHGRQRRPQAGERMRLAHPATSPPEIWGRLERRGITTPFQQRARPRVDPSDGAAPFEAALSRAKPMANRTFLEALGGLGYTPSPDGYDCDLHVRLLGPWTLCIEHRPYLVQRSMWSRGETIKPLAVKVRRSGWQSEPFEALPAPVYSELLHDLSALTG